MVRARPELVPGVRSLADLDAIVLFYLTDKQGITVVRVLHHARDVNRATF